MTRRLRFRHLATERVGTPAAFEGFQAKRRLEGAGNRTVNMDVGALRQVLKRFKQWRRLEDDVRMLTESGGEPIGRVLTTEEQERLLKTAEDNSEWEHVRVVRRATRSQYFKARRRSEARTSERLRSPETPHPHSHK
jgi:hypothetical protein